MLPLAVAQPISLDLRAARLPTGVIDGLYVHIPFCFHKCHYCDFYSITRQTPERMQRFVDLLLAEADLWTHRAPRPRTIFFGGGTPSLLPIEAMDRLLTGLRDRFDLSRVDEWTIEVNPATADLDYLRTLRSHGVDRLSFGAQSFVPDELKMLERHHAPADVERSIAMAREAGFTRLNVDLIYAIPGQSIDSWRYSLDQALRLKTPHLSCYGLTYESNTPMTVRKRLGQFTGADDDTELAMFDLTRNLLAGHGIDWYEISNYAMPGEACRHNLVYWCGGNYIGLGPSAASHVEGHRFKNRPHLGEWEQAVPGGALPVVEHEVLAPEQRVEERIMLELRLRRGVRWRDFSDDLRANHAAVLARLRDLNLLTVDDIGFRLTVPGLHVADSVAGEFVR